MLRTLTFLVLLILSSGPAQLPETPSSPCVELLTARLNARPHNLSFRPLLAARCPASASPLASCAPLPRPASLSLPDPRADVCCTVHFRPRPPLCSPVQPCARHHRAFLSTLQLFAVPGTSRSRHAPALAAHPQRASTAAQHRCQLRARPHETDSATKWLRAPSRSPLASCILTAPQPPDRNLTTITAP